MIIGLDDPLQQMMAQNFKHHADIWMFVKEETGKQNVSHTNEIVIVLFFRYKKLVFD